jgi:hypothetical protein
VNEYDSLEAAVAAASAAYKAAGGRGDLVAIEQPPNTP